MTASKTERFESLRHLAGGKESGAARKLAESLNEMRSKEAELAKLREYVKAYGEEAGGADATVDSARWKNSRLFLSRLNAAVTHGQSEFDAARERYEQEAERWRACHRQTEALQQLVDKYYLKDIQATELREQKELDDRASRAKID